MSSLVIRNIRPWGHEPVDLAVDEGVFTSLIPTASAPTGTTPADAEVIDGRGLLALPGFVNSHAHADKSWWGMPWVSYGGEGGTQGRIAHERAERDSLGVPSVEATTAVLREFLRHGTTAVRSHVDVDTGVGLHGIEVLREANARLGDVLDVEIVAFPQDGVLRRPGVAELLERAAQDGVASIGGLDPAGIDRDPAGQIELLARIAENHGTGIDIHLHDGGTLGLFQYELLLDAVRDHHLHGRVNVSHGFGLGEVPASRIDSLLDELAAARMSWTTVAPVGSVPLPWHGMQERGIEVGLGTDGIRDLWSPFGDGDMLKIALQFARLHGLRTDQELTTAVALASSRAASFVHRERHDLAEGCPGGLVLLDAENVPDALVRTPRRELVVAAGRVVTRAGEVLV
jgi:cytosine deaminase